MVIGERKSTAGFPKRRFWEGLAGALLFSACMAVGVSGCASMPGKTVALPMTPALLTELGPENFQYLSFFLSKDIRLERFDYYQDRIVFAEGAFTRVDKDVVDIIKFDSAVPGDAEVSMSIMDANILYWLLGIKFEDDKEYMLGFAADMADPEGRFEVLLDNETEGLVQYGDYLYYVVYSGDERPYLMVKMNTLIEPEDYSHQAAGRTKN
jgi:hypothetical protein